MKTLTKNIKITAVALSLGLSLSACSNTVDRLANVGSAPEMTRIENPQLKSDYKPVSMPMPAPKVAKKEPNPIGSFSAILILLLLCIFYTVKSKKFFTRRFN